MTDRITLFADVILPVPIYQEFTYRIPFELNNQVQNGIRVIVPFGKNKRITGVISNIHTNAPKVYTAKYIEFLLDEKPIVLQSQLNFWKWMASYYMAPIGDVMNAALPANLKLASETKIVLHPDFSLGVQEFNEKENTILEILAHRESISLSELSEILEVKNIHIYIKKLIDKRAIVTLEEINQRYTAKTKLFIYINDQFTEEEIGIFLDEFQTKNNLQKQFQGLLQLIKLSTEKGSIYSPIEKSVLVKEGLSSSVLQSLEKKGLIVQEKLQIDRITQKGISSLEAPILTDVQKKALEEIESGFTKNDTVLLHGVTGSGKTEIYIQLIQSYLDLGKQVLFLLPEIALTTQLIQRLSKYFGKQIGVYHSRFNQNERVEIWNKVLENNQEEFNLIVGARSAIFLPFQDLGLIIVDEEHDGSFKQHEPSPRYNARDAAIVMAKTSKAKIVLGSATPSLESYLNTQQGKYEIIKLNQRFQDLEMPEILLANTRSEKKQKSMHSHFSSLLFENIKEALENKEQIILFQNRRGFTPLWTCEICNWTPKCEQCDVSLTYHKHSNLLKCHYCGFCTNPIGSCKACGSNQIKMIGFGTEKIEDEIQLFFPEAKVGRMDYDTTRTKNAYSDLIEKFENRELDILIGTQMLSKGLDFDNVSLVGILDADMLLNRPDFRAYERAFQLMTQVSGRSGRKLKRGRVVIQTGQPDHWVFPLVMEHNVDEFLKTELLERENFKYPPYYKMIIFTLKHIDENLVNWASKDFAEQLRSQFKERVLGPEFPLMKKIQNKFQKEIKLKYEKSLSDKKIKEHLSTLLTKFYENVNFKSVKVIIDVDPN